MKAPVVGNRASELAQIQHAPNKNNQCRNSHTDLEHAPHCGLKSLIFSIEHSESPSQAVEDHFNPQRNNDKTENETQNLDMNIDQEARANERPREDS